MLEISAQPYIYFLKKKHFFRFYCSRNLLLTLSENLVNLIIFGTSSIILNQMLIHFHVSAPFTFLSYNVMIYKRGCHSKVWFLVHQSGIGYNSCREPWLTARLGASLTVSINYHLFSDASYAEY